MTSEKIKEKAIKFIFDLTKNLEHGESYERGDTYLEYKGKDVDNFMSSPEDMMEENVFKDYAGNQEMVNDLLDFIEDISDDLYDVIKKLKA